MRLLGSSEMVYDRPKNVHTSEILQRTVCTVTHTMPTLEGELTSIYSMLDCQQLFLFSCEILFCFGGTGAASKEIRKP